MIITNPPGGRLAFKAAGMLLALLWLATLGRPGVSAARSPDGGSYRQHPARHVTAPGPRPGQPSFLGQLTKRDYGAEVFRTRFPGPLAVPGQGRLMVHVNVTETWPVIINTVQIRHQGERIAYHIGRRMGPGWNEIALGHIPWQRGELIISLDHGRGSQIAFYWQGQGQGQGKGDRRHPSGYRRPGATPDRFWIHR